MDTQKTVKDFQFVKRRSISSQDVPDGWKKGINYGEDDSTVGLVLEAPFKEFVYVVGDFSNWEVKSEFLMNTTPNGELFWLEITGLESGKEYVFQYWVDGEIKIADPYSDKVADPWNDSYISNEVYPGLPDYSRQDYGIASVLQTGQSKFEWSASENTWVKPAKEELIIYELLIRDFIGSHNYKDLTDTLTYLKKLGVNAIELMPIMEFEGNESWGYNPTFFFAPDKYYGTKNDLKHFIQKAHQEGFAVLLDMVLNHAYGQNPMVKMYWDESKNSPSTDNPWFNAIAKHPFNVGFDFNHESSYTQSFVDDVNAYWLKEYHFDGFRFDLSKGFTQKNNPNNVNAWSSRDNSRIALLKRMANKLWEEDAEAYVILEHFANNSEENELQKAGMLSWANYTHDYGNLLIGNSADIEGAENLNKVAYMESHDEERLMFKALKSGTKTTTYSIDDELVALNRIKMLAAFFYTLPGPKMMWQFQELGYDIGINFNGRIGNKPLIWGAKNLGLYEDEERQKLFAVHAAIIDLVKQNRTTFSSGILSKNLGENVKTLSFEGKEMDAYIIGNFGMEEEFSELNFPAQGMWYSYFQTDSMDVTDVPLSLNLQPGEFHIYTTKKVSDVETGLLTVFDPIVFTEPTDIAADDESVFYLKADLAVSSGIEKFSELQKIYLAGGVITDAPNGTELKYLRNDISENSLLQLSSAEDNIWSININPRTFFGVPENQEIFRIGLYFQSEDTLTKGMAYYGGIIWLNLKSSKDVVKVSPSEFQKDTEITITFDASAASSAGTLGLIGASKVYMHAGIIISSEKGTAWEYVKGNWGKDDGIGKMSKVANSDFLWEITLKPENYFSGIPSNANWYRIGMVFRNEDGTREGKSKKGGDIFVDFTEKLVEGVLAEKPKLSLVVYPNPSQDRFRIDTKEEIKSALLFNALGEQVLEIHNRRQFSTNGMPTGVYFLRIETGLEMVTKRIIIR